MASNEELLLLAAAQEKENQITPEQAALILGTVGAGSGAAIGDLPQGMIEAIQSKPKTTGEAIKRAFKPGLRVKAGVGLGLAAGGIGGVAALNQPNNALELLARVKAGLPYTEEEVAAALGQMSPDQILA